MPIKWRDALTIDQGPIDRDHRALIAIINEFENVRPGPDAAANLGEIIAKLERYGSMHFRREERLQRLVRFPAAGGHSQQHRHLMRSLVEARSELRRVRSDKELGAFHQHMCGFLNDWLIGHIIKCDLPMKAYVKAMAPHADLLVSLHAAVCEMAG